MKIKKISKVGMFPTWDLHIPNEEHYITENGCVSHNTSIILGISECFEPFTSNIFVRNTGAGEFVNVNKYLVQDLEELNLWDKKMSELIIYYEGSIQDIDIIPQYLKDRYRTAYEISQRDVIDLAAIRQQFIDQSQSMNLFFPKVTYTKISSALMYAWEKGLKTGSYYIRTERRTDKPKRLYMTDLKPKPVDSKFECFGCSS